MTAAPATAADAMRSVLDKIYDEADHAEEKLALLGSGKATDDEPFDKHVAIANVTAGAMTLTDPVLFGQYLVGELNWDVAQISSWVHSAQGIKALARGLRFAEVKVVANGMASQLP